MAATDLVGTSIRAVQPLPLKVNERKCGRRAAASPDMDASGTRPRCRHLSKCAAQANTRRQHHGVRLHQRPVNGLPRVVGARNMGQLLVAGPRLSATSIGVLGEVDLDVLWHAALLFQDATHDEAAATCSQE